MFMIVIWDIIFFCRVSAYDGIKMALAPNHKINHVAYRFLFTGFFTLILAFPFGSIMFPSYNVSLFFYFIHLCILYILVWKCDHC